MTTNTSGIYATINNYEEGIYLIYGYKDGNYTLQPDSQWVNVTT